MAFKKDLPAYTVDDFKTTSSYTSMTEKVKDIFDDLLNKAASAGIGFLIKVRGDALALVPSTNRDNNIITIRPKKGYLRIEVFHLSNDPYYRKEDINEKLIDEMRRVYHDCK